MAASNNTTKLPTVIWYWSNTDDEYSISMKWTAYNDTQNKMIEQAYQNRELSTVIHPYQINFKNMTQINNDVENKRQLVKRIVKNGDHNKEQLREDRSHTTPPLVTESFKDNQKWGSKFISKWYDNFMQMHRSGDLNNIDTEYSIFLVEAETRYEQYLSNFPNDIKNNPKNKGHIYEFFNKNKFGHDSWRCPECISFAYLDPPQCDYKKCIRCFDCFKKHEGSNIQLFDEYLEKQRRKSPDALLHIDILKATQRGIVHEGTALGEEREANLIREELNKVIHRDRSDRELPFITENLSSMPWRASVDPNELRKLCARLYTKPSFLYKVVNKSLRDEDLSKCDTLGPFSYLLYNYTTNQSKQVIPKTVYRCVQLTEDQISTYKNFRGKGYMKWLGFTSTSRNREQSEDFGNTLFVIDLCCPHWRIGADISSISYCPLEEEVLLPAGVMFKIAHIDPTSKNSKHVISLTIDKKAI